MSNTHNLNSVDIMFIIDALIEQSKNCNSITTAKMTLDLINKVKGLTAIKLENLPNIEQILEELQA